VRTIVVWKLAAQVIGGGYFFAGCVRTIVVWKHNRDSKPITELIKLRENHSGMETWSITSASSWAALVA